MTPSTTRRRRSARLVPAGLVLLGLVPVIAGGVRLADLAGGGPVAPADARFHDAPVPVVVHIVGATAFALLGALQFAPGLRRRRWHRVAGRIAVPGGLAAALSGLWMAVAYPRPAGDDAAVEVLRLVFGSFMTVALVLGLVAIRAGDVARHRAWITRGYAVGMGAGTQVFTHVPLLVAGVEPAGVPRTVAMAAGWVINLAVAEWVLRRSGRDRRPLSAGGAARGGRARGRQVVPGGPSGFRPARGR